MKIFGSATLNKLTSMTYDKNYYAEHKQAGLDYLDYGYWQASYARMVSTITLQSTYNSPSVFDAGCACGAILNGFRDTRVYGKLLGVDLSDHMIDLGRKHFKFSNDQLKAGSIADIHAADETFSLVHSHQVLEHIPDELTEKILSEFSRVLRPGGRAFLCLDSVRTGETKEIYMGDPTHCNIQPIMYWTTRLQKYGLYFDVEAYNNFVRSEDGPTQGDPRNFFQSYPFWSAWALIKSV